MNGETEKNLPTTEQLESELKRLKHRREYFRILRNTISSLIVVAAVAVLLSMLLLPVLRVTGSSMTPSLQNDELVMCNKHSDINRGDIIAFYYNNKILLKRVIGVSGDEIEVKEDGTVYINGEELDEPYLEEKTLGECDIEMPYQVPEQKVFVMGDHRSTSIDSRSSVVGCVSEEAIIGKVIFRLWPFKEIGKI
ncbi:MAG: signal peptidase I [Hominimerdicola sp.]